MDYLEEFPVLVTDGELHSDTAEGPATRAIVDYLTSSQEFDTLFPGFENEVHGVDVVTRDGRRVYCVYCVGE
ncbi:MAG: arginine decarboxylase [Methanoculleus sp.]|nr:arginine decarboxylase [Methanoculleus sp.]MDK2989980.1 arginine decarboxylase [Methanoculleus sp.]